MSAKSSDITVGVLALQGAFQKHIIMLNSIGVKAIEVRTIEQLFSCKGLIIPGGESPTMMKLMSFIGFQEPFRVFAQKNPVFGTCAGLILMAKEIIAKEIIINEMMPFKLIDISVERNAFGRQIESFQAEVNVELENKISPLEAFFIRAPRIRALGTEVQVLGSYENEPILVQQGHHLASTFHPELTKSDLIHRYFLKLIKGVTL